jgi:ABC-type Fe3+-hydroxamate transport system substrate-binding protein
MNQEAIDHLWAQQDKENKKIVASYEKRFAKWKEWHDEFGEAVAAQEKEVAEKALKKAQANLEKARARVDSLSEEEKS